ncbi:MAG TPA: hypothetical protein VGO55_03255 [Allosphingosinicella sp.]|jgi:hypothetical protein|nr:hypothetical protein [Allosphingosinicella sp.]
MPAWLQIVLAGLGGAGSAIAVQWMRTFGVVHATERTFDAKLQEHWTDTTLELVDALRSELHEAREELSGLRPLMAKMAHFEEALDHIHALLAAMRSESEPELKAAERRAQAFLRRMRGDEQKGEERQAVQRKLSARRVVGDAAPDTDD